MTTPARRTAGATVPGTEDALGWPDGWQPGAEAAWIVTRDGERIVAHRVLARADGVCEGGVVFPAPFAEHGYAGPNADATVLFVSGEEALAAVDTTGRRLWTVEHEAWSSGGSGDGACAASPDGRYVLATVPGPVNRDGSYDGDLCIAVDAASGEVLDRVALTAASATYAFDGRPTAAGALLLSAGQGQEDALSYTVTCTGGKLDVTPATRPDELLAGTNAAGDRLITVERAGTRLQLHALTGDGTWQVTASIAIADIPGAGDDRFVNRPGFLSDTAVIAAVAEHDFAETSRHFLLDARTLALRTELAYPVGPGPDPLALGDGTWLTTGGDRVARWTADTP
ncbi:PQQ-binding-like beta-propeller repeat protein [Kitasatospora sp. NPDC048365]|uniref:outer membrane protein assembly factor BamB family protein n=1 Tax=Kitasatospora sp. NPDC048365 TaxID=3364050 RepID=UPI00371811B2